MTTADNAANALAAAGMQVFDLISKEQIFTACGLVGLDEFGGECFGIETGKAIRRQQYVVSALIKAGYIRRSTRSDARMYRVLRLPLANSTDRVRTS